MESRHTPPTTKDGGAPAYRDQVITPPPAALPRGKPKTPPTAPPHPAPPPGARRVLPRLTPGRPNAAKRPTLYPPPALYQRAHRSLISRTRHLSNFPTTQQVEKPTTQQTDKLASWQVGTHHQPQGHGNPRITSSRTPPPRLTRLNVPPCIRYARHLTLPNPCARRCVVPTRQVSDFPTSQQTDKLASRKVGKHCPRTQHHSHPILPTHPPSSPSPRALAACLYPPPCIRSRLLSYPAGRPNAANPPPPAGLRPPTSTPSTPTTARARFLLSYPGVNHQPTLPHLCYHPASAHPRPLQHRFLACDRPPAHRLHQLPPALAAALQTVSVF